MGRREYGKGSLIYVGTIDRYVARIRIGGKVKKRTFKDRSDGDQWLKTMTAGYTSVTDYTVGEWLKIFINTYRRPFLRPRSLERVEQAAKKLEPLYDIKLKYLTSTMIQGTINDMIAAGLSPSSIKKSYELLKAAIRLAIGDRIIKDDPILTVRRPSTKEKKRIEILTRRELGAVFHALRKLSKNKRNTSQRYDMILFFRILLTTGIRVSELLALKWSNVEANAIHINFTKALDSQELLPPKTASGYRTVPLLNKKTRDMLLTGRGDGYVFQNKNGGAMTYQRAYLTWKKACSIAGVNKGIHALRHTCISYMLTYCNIPIAQVSKLAGHATPAITLSVYTHAIEEYNIQKSTHLVHNEKEKDTKIVFF